MFYTEIHFAYTSQNTAFDFICFYFICHFQPILCLFFFDFSLFSLPLSLFVIFQSIFSLSTPSGVTVQHLLQKDNLSKRERERDTVERDLKARDANAKEAEVEREDSFLSTCLFVCKTDSQRDTLATPGAGAVANS